jgi:hypothetical protein
MLLCDTGLLLAAGNVKDRAGRADKTPGGAKGTRTPDPLLAKQVLFQLSYSPRETAGHTTDLRA